MGFSGPGGSTHLHYKWFPERGEWMSSRGELSFTAPDRTILLEGIAKYGDRPEDMWTITEDSGVWTAV